MIPKGMNPEDANAKLQEINRAVIEMISEAVPNAPGEDYTTATGKLWKSFCTGGEAAYKKALDDLIGTYAEIKKAHGKLAEMTEKLASSKATAAKEVVSAK